MGDLSFHWHDKTYKLKKTGCHRTKRRYIKQGGLKNEKIPSISLRPIELRSLAHQHSGTSLVMRRAFLLSDKAP